MLFKSNKLFDLKSKKTLVKIVIQKLILLKTCVIKLWNIDNHQWIYVNFSIFFCMLQVKAITFWDLTTWNCVIFMYTYMYVKLRFITAQEVSFLEFQIPNFCEKHIFSLFLTKHLELAQFYCFTMELLSPWCWIYLFNQLTLIFLCLNLVKHWHQETWLPLKMSQFWLELMSISIYLSIYLSIHDR